MSWQPQVDELAYRKSLAKEMGGKENVERQHKAGKLTVRERIDRLLDRGSFREIGSLAGRATYEQGRLTSFTPSNFVMGMGKIDGRRVSIGGEDFTVRGGAADAAVGSKWLFAERMAIEYHVPIIRLIDGTGGSVRTFEQIGRTYVPDNPGVPEMVKLLGEVPVISVAIGNVAGLPAAKAVAAHWTVMVKDKSCIFVAGPPVVKRSLGIEITKEDLGGHRRHLESGVCDNLAEDEEHCFQLIRRFLSYLPSSVWESPPRIETDDDPQRREEELLSLIPLNRNRPYDARRMLALILDRDSFFELAPFFGRSLITGLARLNGYPVGVLANDPFWYGGSMTADASDKMTRFIDFCDTFHLPVVQFMDQPGFMVGPDAESAATIRRGIRTLFALQQATIPWLAIIVRRCYGVAGGAHGNRERLNLRYAWPSAEWGSLPIEGGVDAAYRREIEAAPDPAARRKEIEERLIQLRSPFRTAEAFGIEEIIDPRDTRLLLCEFVETVWPTLGSQLGIKTRTMRP